MREEEQEIAALEGLPQKSLWTKNTRVVGTPGAFDSQREALRDGMWRNAGLLREEQGLRSLLAQLHQMGAQLPAPDTREAIELHNLHTVGTLIAQSALARQESRGAHARTDFPAKLAGQPLHSSIRDRRVRFVDFKS